MKTTIICLAAAAALTTNSYADREVDYSHLPPRVQQTIREYKGKGQVKEVKTKRLENGQIAYEVDYKERGDEKQIQIGQDGFVLGEERQLEKGHGKGHDKGKHHGKGHDKDEDRDQGEERTTTPPPASTAAPVATTLPAPAPIPVPAATPAPAPAQNQRNAARALAFERQVKAVNALGANEKALQAALVVISKDSGVPVKTLQAQQQQTTVGPAGLLMANELARLTKRPAQQFLAERGGKAGWDAIAERNGVNPDVLLPKLQQLSRVMMNAGK